MRLFLDCVAWKGHTETVRALLEAGANKTLQDNFGETPLHDAALSKRSARLPPTQRSAARAPRSTRTAREAAD